MERRREKGLLLILLFLLVYNLIIVPPLGFNRHEGKKASSGENLTTASDSASSQKRHSEDENKAVDELGSSARETNNLSLTKNNLGSTARETNNLRLQHLTRDCEEVIKKMQSRHCNREQLEKSQSRGCFLRLMPFFLSTKKETS